jgi:hypothetical protein
MAEMLPLGDTVLNLDRVEMIRLDQSRGPGKPGRCHKVYFAVGATLYEDRSASFLEDSEEGIALRRYVDGAETEPRSIPLPDVVLREAGQPVIGPPRPSACPDGCRPTPQAVVDMIHAWEPPPPAVAEACTSLGEGGAA